MQPITETAKHTYTNNKMTANRPHVSWCWWWWQQKQPMQSLAQPDFNR